MDEKKRTACGNTASLIGIIVNICLALGKITVGAVFGVISVMADGLNNLTDCGSSVISMISFKLSSKPADKEHPFGHERAEYICSLAVSFVMFFIAFETFKESLSKIFNPEEYFFSYVVIIVLGISIVLKLCLFLYYRAVAEKIDSSILKAAAADSLGDCVATAIVLVSFFVGKLTLFNVDGYAGILVSLFIAYSSFNILKEVYSMLIGKAPEEELIRRIKEKILSYPDVLGVHDLSVYSYGPNKYFASAHIEVDAKVDVLVSHELIDKIEKEIYESDRIALTGHLDPIVTDDERINSLRAKIETILVGIDTRLSLHDFRMVFGEKRINVLFDVAVPYDFKLTKEELKSEIESRVLLLDQRYCLIITVESCI